MQIHNGEEVDCFELSIQRGRAADFCSQRQVGGEEFGDFDWGLRGQRVRFVGETFETGFGMGLEAGFGKVIGGKPFECFVAVVGILACQRAAADEETELVGFGELRNLLPQQVEDGQIAMVFMDAGSAQLEDLRAQGFKDLKVEFLFAVVSKVPSCGGSCLEPVSADDVFGFLVGDDQMFADLVVSILVEMRQVRMVEAFVQFHIENLEAEFLGGLDFGLCVGQFAGVSCGCNHGWLINYCAIPIILDAEFYDNFTAKLQIGNKEAVVSF